MIFGADPGADSGARTGTGTGVVLVLILILELILYGMVLILYGVVLKLTVILILIRILTHSTVATLAHLVRSALRDVPLNYTHCHGLQDTKRQEKARTR